MVPDVQSTEFIAPVGPLDAPVPAGSTVAAASGQLGYVMASVCSGTAGVAGVIDFVGEPQLTSGGPMRALVYPPPNSAFSLYTTLNGFNISMEQLSSIPQTAQNLICVDSYRDGFSGNQLWYESGDNQTLSIIATTPFESSLYRFYATAIVMGGTLNSTSPTVGNCNTTGASLLDFAIAINEDSWTLGIFTNDTPMATGVVLSTALGMAMGAYSSVSLRFTGNLTSMLVTRYEVLLFAPSYGVYVLIANVIVSAIRLLLDPLKNPELFNSSLDSTVNALADPYMLVREDSEFVLAETSLEKKKT